MTTPTPSPAPQWAKDAAIDYLGNPGGSMTDEDTMYHQCDIDDLAAIITRHAAALSEENERLLGIQSMHDMCVGDLAIALGMQGHESPAEIKKVITALRQWTEQAREAIKEQIEFLEICETAEDRSNLDGDSADAVLEQLNDEAEKDLPKLRALLQSHPAATNLTEEA